MTPTDADLVRAIETGVFRLPTIPGEYETLGICGVQGNFTPDFSNDLLNNVGDFNVTEATMEDTIEQVLTQYRDLGNSACWWTGPNTKPVGIAASLQARGFEYLFTAAGLVSTDLVAEIPVNPKIRVETVADDRMESAGAVFSAAFVFDDDPLPDGLGRLFLDTVQLAPPHFYGRNYVAHLEGVEGAIAAANLFLLPGTGIAMLSGAATLPEHRGNGAYTALVAARFRDAARFGAQAAIIQADSVTSAPICERVGMRKLCELPVFLSEPT